MSVKPNRPEHADKITPIPGADPRFTLKRHLDGYAYPEHGNLHNPTPRYVWLLLLDDRLVDHADKRAALVEAARQPEAVSLYCL